MRASASCDLRLLLEVAALEIHPSRGALDASVFQWVRPLEVTRVAVPALVLDFPALCVYRRP